MSSRTVIVSLLCAVAVIGAARAEPPTGKAAAPTASIDATLGPAGFRLPGIEYTFRFDIRQPSSVGALPQPPMLKAIVAWLANNFGLRHTDALPAVRLVSPQKITAFRFTGILSDDPALAAELPRGQREVVAAFDQSAKTIYLPEGWAGASPAELSVLVHEMVHHLQNEERTRFECPQAAERLAYAAQDKWLSLFGLSLAGEFEIDGFTLLASTRCMA